jgi:hypothetical protein
MGGSGLYRFARNNGFLYIDPVGQRVVVMGARTWHQYQAEYAGRVSEGTAQFAEKVMSALQAGVEGKDPTSGKHVKCLELFLAPPVGSGPFIKYWEIKYRAGADQNVESCRNCPNVKRLKELFDSQSVVSIYHTDFRGLNSSHHPIPIGGEDTNVHVDPNVSVPLPTQGPGGTQGPDKPTGFGPVLWHEAVGHAGLRIGGAPSSHPKEPWNQYGASDARTDPIIGIENEYRGWVGEALRYGKYHARSSEQGKCCPE